MRRLAVLSLHTSPLAQPGSGDGGGMNVYVRELAAALARSGVACDVFTRAWSRDLPPVVEVEPGFRVHHVPAGAAAGCPRRPCPAWSRSSRPGCSSAWPRPPVRRRPGRRWPYTSVHANYWLSGLSGHAIKHELDLPLVCTFHTLDRVKAESMPEEVEADMPHRRAEAEAAIIECSDAVLASCSVEAEQIASLYGATPAASASCRRASTMPSSAPATGPRPGGPWAFPSTGACCSSWAGSSHSSVPTWPWRPWPSCATPATALPARGGRWPERAPRREVAAAASTTWPTPAGCATDVHFVDPQPHELLSSYYRAADVCIVPSRSESFGLVALESAACGTPVVAAAVGGLTTLVDHGHTGFLVDEPIRAPTPTPSGGSSTSRWRPSASPPPRCCGPASTPGAPPRARPGRTARRAGGRPARPVPLSRRPAPAPARVPTADLPAEEEMAAAVACIDAWAARQLAERRLPGGRRAPGGHRPHGVVPLVPAVQR